MRTLGWILAVVGSLVLESTVLDSLKIMGAKPDLLLTIIVLHALVRGPWPGARLGFGLGLLEDLMVGKYIGLASLSKMFIGYLVGLGESRLRKENLLIPVAGLFTATIVYEVAYLVLGGLAGFQPEPSGFLKIVFPTALYNSLVALFVYPRFLRSSGGGRLGTPSLPDPSRLRRM